MWKKIGKFSIWGVMILMAAILIYDQWMAIEIPELRVPGNMAGHYRSIAHDYQVPWYYLAAMDEAEHQYRKTSGWKIEQNAKRLMKEAGPSGHEIEQAIRQWYPKEKAESMIRLANAYRWAASPLAESYAFPFAESHRGKVQYQDSWGASRTYGGNRKHEGTDLMVKAGMPIVSVSEGIVVKKGWNRLGGWRLLIVDRKHPQMSYYYAHLQKYAEGIAVGSRVHRGQLLAYAGATGYGPEGTSGKFPPHLHFGIYVRQSLFSFQSEAINPYPFLRAWDRK